MISRRLRKLVSALQTVTRSACVQDVLISQHVQRHNPTKVGLTSVAARRFSSSADGDSHASKKSLYVLNVEGRRTLGPLLIGLMDYFERWLPNVGFFQVKMPPHTPSTMYARKDLPLCVVDGSPITSLVACMTASRPMNAFLFFLCLGWKSIALIESLHFPDPVQAIAGEPFPGTDSQIPRHVELIHSACGIKDDPHSMYAVTRREVVSMLAQNKADELFDRIYSSYEEYSFKHDLVVIEGTHEGT